MEQLTAQSLALIEYINLTHGHNIDWVDERVKNDPIVSNNPLYKMFIMIAKVYPSLICSPSVDRAREATPHNESAENAMIRCFKQFAEDENTKKEDDK